MYVIIDQNRSVDGECTKIIVSQMLYIFIQLSAKFRIFSEN